MKSNFALFFEEYEKMNTLEKNEGFITYKYDKNTCYIVNIFVRKEYRNTDICYKMADEVVEIAKKNGYNILVGSIDPNSNHPERSKRVLEKYNMKFKIHADNLDWYIKEI